MAFNKWKTGGRLKLEWRYVICPLAFLIVLWVAASFTGHWATEENPYRSYALQACAWLDGRLDLGKDYPWLELAIYEGKYYVSFPPFPSEIRVRQRLDDDAFYLDIVALGQVLTLLTRQQSLLIADSI